MSALDAGADVAKPAPHPELNCFDPGWDEQLTSEWSRRTDCAGLIRRLDDRRYIGVLPLIYTHAVIWGYIADATFGYEDRWCYQTSVEAIAAGYAWDGAGDPPDGWIRQPRTGRRRPDKTPASEHVDF